MAVWKGEWGQSPDGRSSSLSISCWSPHYHHRERRRHLTLVYLYVYYTRLSSLSLSYFAVLASSAELPPVAFSAFSTSIRCLNFSIYFTRHPFWPGWWWCDDAGAKDTTTQVDGRQHISHHKKTVLDVVNDKIDDTDADDNWGGENYSDFGESSGAW